MKLFAGATIFLTLTTVASAAPSARPPECNSVAQAVQHRVELFKWLKSQYGKYPSNAELCSTFTDLERTTATLLAKPELAFHCGAPSTYVTALQKDIEKLKSAKENTCNPKRKYYNWYDRMINEPLPQSE